MIMIVGMLLLRERQILHATRQLRLLDAIHGVFFSTVRINLCDMLIPLDANIRLVKPRHEI